MTDDLGQPPPVEPMNDLAWTRVERGLWARLDGAIPATRASGRSRRWVWIAAPALALAAAAVFALFVKPTGKLPATEPEAPTRIVSGDSPSTISIGDAHVTLDANSAVVMSPAGGATAVVERGAAWFAIAPRTGRPFIVAAGDTTVRVIGTRFRVARSEEHATVEVEHGTVEVTFHGTTLKVSAGHNWSSRLPSTIGERTQTAVADLPRAVTPEPEAVPDPPAAPTPPVVDRGSAKPAKPAKPAEPLPITAIDLDRLEYDRFVALETRDPAAALAGYLELSRGTSRWASVALFAAGRLAADRGDARAKTLLGIYLQRFPRGANADDARTLLDRLKGASR